MLAEIHCLKADIAPLRISPWWFWMRKMSEAFRKSLAMYDRRMAQSGRRMATEAASRPARPDDESDADELGFMAVLRELIPWAAPSHR